MNDTRRSGMGKLVAPPPVIAQDSREQRPLVFRDLASEVVGLQSGDYIVLGMESDFAVERKSVSDLLGSVTRERDRFERELHRLRGFAFKRLVIVGTSADVEAQAPNPKAVFSSLSAIEVKWGVPVYWYANPDAAALAIERWAWFAWRERVRVFAEVPPCPIPWDV